jgi:hypothetical protein
MATCHRKGYAYAWWPHEHATPELQSFNLSILITPCNGTLPHHAQDLGQSAINSPLNFCRSGLHLCFGFLDALVICLTTEHIRVQPAPEPRPFTTKCCCCPTPAVTGNHESCKYSVYSVAAWRSQNLDRIVSHNSVTDTACSRWVPLHCCSSWPAGPQQAGSNGVSLCG